MEIVLATRNRNKIREISKKLKTFGLKFLTLDNFRNFPEVIENKDTLEENAVKKASEISSCTGHISLSDDTGLEVDYLKGAPGVYSARFAGEGCSYQDNNIKLLKLLSNVPLSKRGALFRTVIVIKIPGKKPVILEGRCRGKISFAINGKKGFGYDSIFIPSGYKKTYSEMSLSSKNRISHRGKALDKVKKVLVRLIKIRK
ncbi:MAG: non-canonical purine NTP pyrophosphatase, RdgB/HAM1 family [Candidatus Firestonebacteria bacterium RIFOXYC2_FULL_39_67]|nr:MAG: non-canonical purine NTP pyrophosphatase, RdgB/HAM1 family [Candidatus Firestonebacteria bacterium RIFOXYD2_FULL_39_29]OGF51824.1 MAG: non-canonical purine NTP pyrophosphatase, RdgB/HAM1 family [Candidatus Firestonebacteria bacterium RifOxyC12_full_39_7]OGF53895.1 MAG: non-canonical purine NTP pyrophosphatase, RdgB/HAM1 family [Candidatus Firestonebacteria bacterium RIFOXYC2_FULL_39_67]